MLYVGADGATSSSERRGPGGPRGRNCGDGREGADPVCEGAQLRRSGRGADDDLERRRAPWWKLGAERLVDLVGARARGQRAGVDGQEPGRGERDPERDQHGRAEQGDPAWAADHEPGESVPEAGLVRPRVAFGGALESLRGERVHARPEQREDRRQDDKRKGGCDQRDERAGDPHRAKEQLREDRERRDRGGDRQRAEHDRPARRRERAAQRVDAEAVDGGFLAVAGDHEEAVVDREPEPEAGHHVEREHRQVGEARDDPQREEGRQDREASEQRR